jgi:DNA-binding transcriptional ArsR family regulator
MPAGAIGEKLELPPATLSFHLAHLARAGLVTQVQAGRFVIYSADDGNMIELVGFLTENCCGGKPCAPTARSPAVKAGAPGAMTRARRRV